MGKNFEPIIYKKKYIYIFTGNDIGREKDSDFNRDDFYESYEFDPQEKQRERSRAGQYTL